MITDDDLRALLQREAGAHHADAARIRARFEAGVLQSAPEVRSTARDLTRTGRLRRSSRPALVAAAAAAVVVAAFVVIGQSQPSGVTPAVGSAHDEPTLLATGTGAPSPTPEITGPDTADARPTVDAVTSGPTRTAAGPAPTTATTPGAAAVAVRQRCGRYDTLPVGPLVISNNLWAADRGTGHQCSSVAQGASGAWRTGWDWTGGPGVKSYASAVLGWRWGEATDTQADGLPLRVGNGQPIRTTWTFTLTSSRPGDADVAYDMWFHDTPNPGLNTTPTRELRIVLDQQGSEAQWTQPVATPTVDGVTWGLYRTRGGSWDTYTFVRSRSTTSAALDLSHFTSAMGAVAGTGTGRYLTSIQAGADVVAGAGALSTSAYSVHIG